MRTWDRRYQHRTSIAFEAVLSRTPCNHISSLKLPEEVAFFPVVDGPCAPSVHDEQTDDVYSESATYLYGSLRALFNADSHCDNVHTAACLSLIRSV